MISAWYYNLKFRKPSTIRLMHIAMLMFQNNCLHILQSGAVFSDCFQKILTVMFPTLKQILRDRGAAFGKLIFGRRKMFSSDLEAGKKNRE